MRSSGHWLRNRLQITTFVGSTKHKEIWWRSTDVARMTRDTTTETGIVGWRHTYNEGLNHRKTCTVGWRHMYIKGHNQRKILTSDDVTRITSFTTTPETRIAYDKLFVKTWKIREKIEKEKKINSHSVQWSMDFQTGTWVELNSIINSGLVQRP